MNARNVTIAPALTLLLLVGVTPPTSAMEPLRAHQRDVLFAHAQLDSLRPRAVGLLPVVAFADDPEAMAFVEECFYRLHAETGHEWRPASFARERIAAARGADSLRAELARQVRRTGHLDPATGAAFARLLGVESTLSLRVDRFEVVSGRAMVELTAALVDASGRLLWEISGLSGYGDATIPEASESEGRRLSRATRTLFARWSPAMPAPADRPQLDPADRPIAVEVGGR